MKSLLAGFVLAAALWTSPFLWVLWRGSPLPMPDSQATEAEERASFDPFAAYGRTRAELFRRILRNNLGVGLLALSGFATFGLTTVSTLVANGLVLGLIVREQLVGGMELGQLASLTLPHAVPELIGFWLAGAVGLRGARILVELLQRGAVPTLPTLAGLAGAAGVSFLIITLAAWIEAYVTLRPYLPA